MRTASVKPVRCAIYTRVSTEHGLDQEFNSLDAQYDAASAYIKGQAHAGWALIRSRYDDGGYSGGSTDRPDLQKLLDDIRARKIDVIVVYKVDRLTRSLADFAKLVELFDAHGVSFVSVTQQFNTTTSMGQLTLNVLLSFAQFEREVTSERIRDEIAASKRKGLWVGGPLPLGYAMKDGKIVVLEVEAERVRLIFRRYLELGGVNALVRDLRDKDIRTKIRLRATGATHGGILFERGSLFYLLRNRFYVGKVKYKGEILPGEQAAIMERQLFDAVQQKLTDQWSHRNHAKSKSDHLLTGLLYDDAGHRMIPTHATKGGIRYRYYASLPHLKGESKTVSVGSVSRIPATDIEDIIVKSVNKHLIAQREKSASGIGNCLQTKGALGRRSPPPRLSHGKRQDRRCRGRCRASPPDLPTLSRTRRRERTGTRPPETRYPNQIKTARNGCYPRGCSLRPRLAILSAAQSLLYWRGQIQRRDPAVTPQSATSARSRWS